MATTKATIKFGESRLTIEDIVAISKQEKHVSISNAPELTNKIDSALAFLDSLLKEDGVIYGVTTGYGDSVTVKVPLHLVHELPLHLTRFHGCGLGQLFSVAEGRAVLATRLTSLAQGYSGVSWEMLHLLAAYLEHDIIPAIPQEGSVGASGDLTPLSYVAGALIGERDVYYKDKIRNSGEVMREVGLTPLVL
ncbi:MAG: aromatic amino acid lyase, partial [Moritella sp.]